MTTPIGQLVILGAREILKRILGNPDATVSENEIANVVRQNVIGKATTVIVASGKAQADEQTILLITQRCLDLLSQMSDLEVTFNLAADGTRSVTIRKPKDVLPADLIRSVGDVCGRLDNQNAIVSGSAAGGNANADIMERIREHVNRPEERDY